MEPQPSGSGIKKSAEDGIDDVMGRLGLCDDDLDDVVFEDEAPPFEGEAMRWPAIARISYRFRV